MSTVEVLAGNILTVLPIVRFPLVVTVLLLFTVYLFFPMGVTLAGRAIRYQSNGPFSQIR